MTLHSYKEKVVEEERWIDSKSVHKMLIRLGLFTVLTICALSLVTINVLSFAVTVLAIIIVIAGFLVVLDYSAESLDNLKKVWYFSKYWWTVIVLIVVIYIVLKYFKFL